MRIRKYTGKDMQEALAKVRSDLGGEAVILNSRKVKRRGVAAWFSKPYFEVLAAVDENFVATVPGRGLRQKPVAPAARDTRMEVGEEAPMPRYGAAAYAPARRQEPVAVKTSALQPQGSTVMETGVTDEGGTGPGVGADDRPGANTVRFPGGRDATGEMGDRATTELDALKAQMQSMAERLEWLRTQTNPTKSPVPQAQGAAPPASGAEVGVSPAPQVEVVKTPIPAAAAIPAAAGIGAARHATPVAQQETTPAQAPAAAPAPTPGTEVPASPASGRNDRLSERFSYMTRHLQEQEVDGTLAGRIVDKVRAMLPAEAGDEEIRRQTGRVLAAALGEPETIRLREDGKPCVVAFIGPTGVGKTTTLAKIAAEFTLTHGRKVGLVTADTYRIAAVEQLKTYAEILNLPVSVVYAPQDMPEALKAHQDKDLILIDTAGRSHRNPTQFDELRQLLAAAPIDEVFLVMSVNTGRAACQDILEHYAFVPHYKLLFTKLDETPASGVIFNARLRTGKPLSYVTAGQSVPDDLSVANPAAIAAAAVGTIQ